MPKSFIKLIERSLKDNWNRSALTDYEGETLQYKDIARKIEKFHIVLEASGITKGDRIAICGKNSANWCLSFLAVVTYGCVAVPIQREFKSDDVQNIVNHSGAKILLISRRLWEDMQENQMKELEAALAIGDFTLLFSRNNNLTNALEHRNELFGQKFKYNFRVNHVEYKEEDLDGLALINYTSGTTGFSKGVMLSYRCLSSNIEFLERIRPLKAGEDIVSILPLGHVFGMTCDFLSGITSGVHLWFLSRQASPKIITTMVAQIHPRVMCCVPLVLEKIFKKLIIPKVENQRAHILLRLPFVSDKLKHSILNQAMDCFGGKLESIIVGGAPLNAEIEALMRKIHFPYTAGYGLTETGPLISFGQPFSTPYQSCGIIADNMECLISNPNKEGVGELLTRGMNVMMGYYKNEEATSSARDNEGWLHTGDMAMIDANNYLYIKGRCKNMFLGASGENIYPEEIESRLNNMPMIGESIIVKRGEKLIALVYPDSSQVEKGESKNDIEAVMKENLVILNKELPSYSRLSQIELWPEPFEKTAKKSIKRFLYK